MFTVNKWDLNIWVCMRHQALTSINSQNSTTWRQWKENKRWDGWSVLISIGSLSCWSFSGRSLQNLSMIIRKDGGVGDGESISKTDSRAGSTCSEFHWCLLVIGGVLAWYGRMGWWWAEVCSRKVACWALIRKWTHLYWWVRWWTLWICLPMAISVAIS